MNAITDVQFRDRLRRNINRTLAFGFFQVFLVIMPVVVPFFESRGLSMQQIFLLQALFAVVVLVMEIPSGYAADMLGRRLTMVVGSIFLGLGHSMLLFADGFAELALFELGLGIGVSLVSGADLAILYDSEQALGNDSGRRQELVGRLFTMHTASEALAGVLCSVLLVWSLQDAVYVQVDGHPRVNAIADEDLERENEEKTSSVHFLRFELTPPMIASLKSGADFAVGVEHPAYRARIEALPGATRSALVADLT